MERLYDYIICRDVAELERALDKLGVSKHQRRGLERAGAFCGTPIVLSDAVPHGKAAFVADGVAYVWSL